MFVFCFAVWFFFFFFFFSSRRRHTRCLSDWSSDVWSSDLLEPRGFTRVERSALQALLDALLLVDVALHFRPGRLGGRREIGRASCRERGWLPGRRVTGEVRQRDGGTWRVDGRHG